MSNNKPRYDHIDPDKLKTPQDRALYEALVRYVDENEETEVDEQTIKNEK